ncbi:uncharacterized protein LOC116348701 [Contarinia nasturtii]|uniref:uncharacterized protein LOC116348701 n=1 Tax=Contarinia nasturtii TaxID=265458 RepID=UPI0012D3CC02|nr:uncharacterized protein LOC116348701 [Contarinia nasturtii]
MKFFLLLVAIVSLVQLCSCSKIGKKQTTPVPITDDSAIANATEAVAKLDPMVLINFANIFDKFKPDSTDEENIEASARLLSMAVNGDLAKINQTLFDFWKNRSSSEEIDSQSSDEVYSPFVLDDLSESTLKNLEEVFSKILTPSQTEQAMTILRGLSENATTTQEEATKVSVSMK